MHARAAGSCKAHKGYLLLDSGFYTAYKALAHYGAHATAHEVKLKASRHQADAVHRAAHYHQCVGFSGVFQRFFQAFGVFAAVFELERVNRQDFLADLETAFVV